MFLYFIIPSYDTLVPQIDSRAPGSTRSVLCRLSAVSDVGANTLPMPEQQAACAAQRERSSDTVSKRQRDAGAMPEPPPPVPLAPTLGEKIGEGSYGTVFRRQRDGATVAVKLCKPSNSKTEGVSMAAYRELMALRRLATCSSSCLVELLDTGLEGGSVSLTLGFVETTLRATLAHRPELLTRSATQHVMVKCAHALEFMHCRWFVHRDLSPGNILVSPDLSSVRVADLGMSRSFLSPAAPLARDGDVVNIIDIDR